MSLDHESILTKIFFEPGLILCKKVTTQKKTHMDQMISIEHNLNEEIIAAMKIEGRDPNRERKRLAMTCYLKSHAIPPSQEKDQSEEEEENDVQSWKRELCIVYRKSIPISMLGKVVYKGVG